MCFKTPKAPAVAAAPDRGSAQAEVTKVRKATAEQAGGYGNIFTSALGDSTYNANTVKLAKLGASA